MVRQIFLSSQVTQSMVIGERPVYLSCLKNPDLESEEIRKYQENLKTS